MFIRSTRKQPLENCLTWKHQLLRGHPCRPCLQSNRMQCHQLFPVVGIYRRSSNGRKCRLRFFGWNFSGAAFCLHPQLVGLLYYNPYLCSNFFQVNGMLYWSCFGSIHIGWSSVVNTVSSFGVEIVYLKLFDAVGFSSLIDNLSVLSRPAWPRYLLF